MPFTRAQLIWGMVKPQAAAEGVQPVDVERQVNVPVAAVEARARALVLSTKADLQSRQDEKATQLESVLATKAPLAHTHPIAQVTGLQAVITQLQTRLAALEAKVP